MLLSSDSVLHLHPRVSFWKTVCQCELYLEGDYVKKFILFLESLQQWFSDTCPSHECLLPFRSLLLYTLDFHPTRYSLRPNHGELSENRKIDKERNVNFIGHQHGSKSCSGWVHCLSKDLLQPERNFLKFVLPYHASILLPRMNLQTVLVKCRMFLFCLLCEACYHKTTIYRKYKPFPSSKMPFHQLFRLQTASAF